MAAYAALVSLMNLIDQIQHHPRPPITLDNEQTQSLTVKNAFLQDFLEAYNTYDGDQEVEYLRSRIADAAYAAEDVIESHIVDQIHAKSRTRGRDKISTVDLYQGLEKVLQDMDFIEKEVKEIKAKMGSQVQLQRIMTKSVVSSDSSSTKQNAMVGFDDVLYEMLDKLTGQQSRRLIISISGMGGIGKTTLAKIVYSNPLVEHRFDFRAWVTISQEYSVKEILLHVFVSLTLQEKKESLNQKSESLNEKSEQHLGLQLHKNLSGRRYLIIMDDMWSVEAWNKVKIFFPDNNNGSRIVITTRISKLARDLDGAVALEMSFLDGDKSWHLLCRTVFGEQRCPDELEQIGKRVAENCRGLPLSIVVIGGVLAKSKQTQEYWEHIAENLNQVVNLDDNERCLKILRTSYNQLPIHLKPCFLYMGSFPEDSEICISRLIQQWIAEGFLKPSKAYSLEETAEEYLMDLVERNLILVSTRGGVENQSRARSTTS